MREQAVRGDRVAVYIRWSTDDQSDGTTLEVQREACRHFILSQGWEFSEALLFVDDGYSGATLDRPALDRLRRLCREGAVDCVVVYKLDRLSRSVVDTVKLVMEEWDGRIALKSARESIDTSTPMGRQVFYLLVSYAEWERNVIRERTASGKWKRAQEGRNPGFVAPYGYRNAGGGRFALAGAEAPVVRRIFAEALQQRSVRQIAGRLNGDGVPSRAGRGWSAAVVAKLLRNPAYLGTLVYGRMAGRSHGDGAPVWVEGVFPPIVDRGTYEAVQASLAERRPARLAPRAASGGALLTGLAVCARCGAAITSHRRQGERYRYYRCGGALAKGGNVCGGGYIPVDEVDAAVRQGLLDLYEPGRRLPERLPLLAPLRDEVQRLRAGVRQATARLTAVGRGAQRAHQAFLAGEVDSRRASELLARSEEEQANAAADLQRLRRDLELQEAVLDRARGAGPSAGAVVPTVVGFPTAAAAAWDQLDTAERKAVLRALLAGARLGPPGPDGTLTLELTWRTQRHANAESRDG